MPLKHNKRPPSSAEHVASLNHELAEFDQRHIWHPFTQHQIYDSLSEPLVFSRGEGFDLIDTDGNRYLDGFSSIWCNVHGHGVPQLVEAIQQQAAELCHSTLLGMSHRPIVELTRALRRVVPDKLQRFFYADSGSNAVEAALRMCIEWWQKQTGAAARKRTKFLSLNGSYHGDTLGSVSVGFCREFHAALAPIVVQALRFDPPHVFRFYQQLSLADACERSLSNLRTMLETEGDSLAAVIIEPLMQAAAGIWDHPPAYLNEVCRLCREREVLVILDEVATGFGKSGKLFAFEALDGFVPDVLVLAKGLTGGYLPLSVAITTDRIFEGFLGEIEEYKALYYGQTFAGAAVATASLQLFESHGLLNRLPQMIRNFHELLDSNIAPLAHVDEIRRVGVMVGIELTSAPGERKPYQPEELAGWRIANEARKRGGLIRPLGNVMILMPAVAMDDRNIEKLVSVTAESIVAALGDN